MSKVSGRSCPGNQQLIFCPVVDNTKIVWSWIVGISVSLAVTAGSVPQERILGMLLHWLQMGVRADKCDID